MRGPMEMRSAAGSLIDLRVRNHGPQRRQLALIHSCRRQARQPLQPGKPGNEIKARGRQALLFQAEVLQPFQRGQSLQATAREPVAQALQPDQPPATGLCCRARHLPDSVPVSCR